MYSLGICNNSGLTRRYVIFQRIKFRLTAKTQPIVAKRLLSLSRSGDLQRSVQITHLTELDGGHVFPTL